LGIRLEGGEQWFPRVGAEWKYLRYEFEIEWNGQTPTVHITRPQFSQFPIPLIIQETAEEARKDETGDHLIY